MKPGFLQIRRCTFPTWGENWRHAFKLMECIFHLFIPEGIRHTYTHTHTQTLPTRFPPPRTPPAYRPKRIGMPVCVVQTENEQQEHEIQVTTNQRTKFSSKSDSPPPRYQHIFFHLPEPLFITSLFFSFPRRVDCNDVPSPSVSHQTQPARRRSSVLHKETALCNCILGSPPIERRRLTISACSSFNGLRQSK